MVPSCGQLAAAWQHAHAQFQLGFAYEKGRGVLPSLDKRVHDLV